MCYNTRVVFFTYQRKGERVMRKLALKRLIKDKILKNKNSSEELLDRLRQGGAQIGTDVWVYSTNNTILDSQAPYLLKIGDYVRIADGVKILTHDYSWSVLKCYSSAEIDAGAVLGAQSAVEIGSNVFIGMNAIITRGVSIGNNVVIGAGSVVTKDCPADGVYAGNPAKRIMSIAEYYEKRRSLQFAEAKDMARRYQQRFGKEPPMEIFSEYFMLFLTAEQAQAVPKFREQMRRMGNYEDTVRYMEKHPPTFAGYAAFLAACYQETEND